ncbi:zf-HC2 domain-containing protein [Nonomuraea sp. NPDC026600]|uniref:anti-sigma factor family protein n=1 Tax=Nonomuraea sp. NPDC026600 TaxID=3155363 RepID=UPI0033F0B098
MTGDTHYDLEILAELAEGLLDAGTARQVREHLAVCDPCGELLADLAAVREVLAATPTPAMPMGVALRIDKALAAEAGSGRGGVGLAEPPNWDELMRDSPWVPGNDPLPGNDPRQEPVRLGVVSDDGTIVPAGRKAARRRRWAMPAVAAAAAAAVVGTAVLSTNLFSGGGTIVAGQQGVTADAPSPTRVTERGKAYALTDSGHNYSDQELKQPLESFFGPAPIVGGGSSDVDGVDKCVNRVANRTKLKVFAVDQGQYNGQEAVIMTSWKNKSAKTLRIDIVDPFNCKNLRKPTVGSW